MIIVHNIIMRRIAFIAYGFAIPMYIQGLIYDIYRIEWIWRHDRVLAQSSNVLLKQNWNLNAFGLTFAFHVIYIFLYFI
jgi:hypothetical protein